MFEWISYMDFQPIVIGTKADKIKPQKLNHNIKILKESLGADFDTIIQPFSSVTGEGREEIWDFLLQIIENEKED